MDKNYRGKQKISDLIAPPKRQRSLGLETGTVAMDPPIKRRCAGPLQETKFEIHKRKMSLEMNGTRYKSNQTLKPELFGLNVVESRRQCIKNILLLHITFGFTMPLKFR